MFAVVRDRVTELAVDCGLSAILMVGVMYALLTLFRRSHGAGPRG